MTLHPELASGKYLRDPPLVNLRFIPYDALRYPTTCRVLMITRTEILGIHNTLAIVGSMRLVLSLYKSLGVNHNNSKKWLIHNCQATIRVVQLSMTSYDSLGEL